MEKENQIVEWKVSWRDEFLGWICGYANAKGGILYIGKNDDGEVVGIDKANKLLEDLPNKVRDVLGIMVDVNLLSENNHDYLQIIVEPYTHGVNYKGEYHYRTGSTKQILKGPALGKFLLDKAGKTWDSIEIPNIHVTDLDAGTFDYFKANFRFKNRIDTIKSDNLALLESLHLIENQKLTRAAVLLFHPNPEKYVRGSFIKIAFFGLNNTDLLFQDEIKCSILSQFEKTIDLLKTKYFQASISYNKSHRIEKYPYPDIALREALLNAIVHKDYSTENPIQISVYPNKLQIWNEGKIPEEWTLEKFLGKHPSKPHNPNIANTFFQIGLIEEWGRGIESIFDDCKNNNIENPSFDFDFGGLRIEFTQKNKSITTDALNSFDEIISKLIINKQPEITVIEAENIIEIINKLDSKSSQIITILEKESPLKRQELMSKINVSNQTNNAKRFLEPLINLNIISPTIKEISKSSNQQYILTNYGKKVAVIINQINEAKTIT